MAIMISQRALSLEQRRNLVWNNVTTLFQLHFNVVPTSDARWDVCLWTLTKIILVFKGKENPWFELMIWDKHIHYIYRRLKKATEYRNNW